MPLGSRWQLEEWKYQDYRQIVKNMLTCFETLNLIWAFNYTFCLSTLTTSLPLVISLSSMLKDFTKTSNRWKEDTKANIENNYLNYAFRYIANFFYSFSLRCFYSDVDILLNWFSSCCPFALKCEIFYSLFVQNPDVMQENGYYLFLDSGLQT